MYQIGRANGRSPVKSLVWLLLGGLFVRSLIAVWLPPGFDEAYYYLYTQNLDWSYFDHPLMVAFTTGFGVWLTGHVSQFTIRIGTLLLYTGSLIFLYLTSVRLFSARAGVFTVAIASLIPIFVIAFGVLTLPDSPLIFFWAATLYVATEEFFHRPDYRPSYRLVVIGLLVGLACLSKYHGLALGFGLIGFCCTSSRHRSALLSPWTIAAIGLFLVTISPIVYWNIQHDWVSLRYQSGRAIPDRGYSLLELLGTFLIGVAYLFPTFGFPLWWVSLREGGKAKEEKNRTGTFRETPVQVEAGRRLILWLALPLMFGFTLMGGYRPILPTWAMPGFFGATVLLGERTATWQERSPQGVQRWLWGSGLVIGALLLVALLHLNLGTLQKPSRFAWFGGFLPSSADASVQLVDIQQIRQGFKASSELTTALEQADFVFTNEIFLAGQVGMAIAPLQPPPVTAFTEDLRGFAFWSTAQAWVGKNGLYVTSTRLPNAELYQEYFQTTKRIGEIPIQRGDVIVETIQVYQAKNLLKPFPRPNDLVEQVQLP
ncbi:MAG: glycosyltransferase family 39 protein [Leptolyngbyaceae cyanobacterium bins.302]|nr:glycosyltransferase family 39 protein [Leptolyngbyaceae cyanobacterium bins.302]